MLVCLCVLERVGSRIRFMENVGESIFHRQPSAIMLLRRGGLTGWLTGCGGGLGDPHYVNIE